MIMLNGGERVLLSIMVQVTFKQAQDVDPMLGYCWPSVEYKSMDYVCWNSRGQFSANNSKVCIPKLNSWMTVFIKQYSAITG